MTTKKLLPFCLRIFSDSFTVTRKKTTTIRNNRIKMMMRFIFIHKVQYLSFCMEKNDIFLFFISDWYFVCERENQNSRQEKTKFWQQIIIEVVDAFKIFCLMKKLIPIWSKKSLWSKSFWYKQYCSIIDDDDDDEIDIFFLQHSFDTIYMQSVILFVSCHMINQTIVVYYYYYYNNNWNIHLKLNLNIHKWESKLEKK